MGKDGGQHSGPLPVVLEVDGSQEGVPDAEAESKTSTKDSIEETRRTYPKYNQGEYYLPNDDEEQDRLDLQHHLFSLTFDGELSLAPIKTPNRVLDIGTGTGIWAVEYALQNPSATVIGSDISPIERKFIPPNCQFLIADAEAEWNYPTLFNYIHGRALFTCFHSPLSVFRSAFSSLAPGGYLEMQEIYFRPHSQDTSIAGTALESWNTKVIEGAKVLGKDWWCTPNYKRWFEETGFMDVEEKVFYWPGNEWAKGEKQKKLGRKMLTNSLKGLSAVSMMVFTKVFGMSVEEVDTMLADVRKDMNNLNIHTYYPIHVVFGRKPF